MPNESEGHDEAWLMAFVLLLLLIGGNTTRRLTRAQSRQARSLLRAKFEVDVQRLADAIAAGTLAVALWQEQMQKAMDDYARTMAIAGAGALPSATTQAIVEARLQEQVPFLNRFAGLVGAGLLSAAAIAARASLYGGVGWDAYWRGAEGAVSVKHGQIVHYVARDDNGTCAPCRDAQANGPYVVGRQHPVPGSACLGGGRCRCELRFEYNPQVYARLTG